MCGAVGPRLAVAMSPRCARGRGVVLPEAESQAGFPSKTGRVQAPMTTSLHLAVLGTHPGSWGKILILVAMLTEDFIEAFVLK